MPFDVSSAVFEWKEKNTSQSLGPCAIRQTHKAILIPIKGLVYEPLQSEGCDRLMHFRQFGNEEQILFPLPEHALEKLMDTLTYVYNMQKLDNKLCTSQFRVDGVMIRDTDDIWNISVVGLNDI